MEKTVRRWGFYGKRQVYLFMVWEEDWYGNGVIYARVKFTFLEVHSLLQLHARYLAWADRSWWRKR